MTDMTPDTTPQALSAEGLSKCWCGGNPLVAEDSADGESPDFYCWCPGCEENTASYQAREDAVNAWNLLMETIRRAVSELPAPAVIGAASINAIRKTAKNKTVGMLLAVIDDRDATIAAKDAEIAKIKEAISHANNSVYGSDNFFIYNDDTYDLARSIERIKSQCHTAEAERDALKAEVERVFRIADTALRRLEELTAHESLLWLHMRDADLEALRNGIAQQRAALTPKEPTP